jgi:hypothetical protein
MVDLGCLIPIVLYSAHPPTLHETQSHRRIQIQFEPNENEQFHNWKDKSTIHST